MKLQVTGATKLVSLMLLHNDVCWDLLQERRQKHKLIQIFKMKNNFCPEYLTYLVPFYVGDRNPYNLRNANNIQLIHSRTTLYYNSFLPWSIRLWNELPSDKRNNPSVNSFKTYLNRNTQILHTRLRLKCSSLNNHLFLISLTLQTVCGENETNHHHLFECPLYNHIRLTLCGKLP